MTEVELAEILEYTARTVREGKYGRGEGVAHEAASDDIAQAIDDKLIGE